jgi:hypothetical protein
MFFFEKKNQKTLATIYLAKLAGLTTAIAAQEIP